MAEEITIEGLSKAALLAELYNRSQPQGRGHLIATSDAMTVADAQKLLDETPKKYFDYVQGRVMKVDLSGNRLDPWMYDRDNGEGAAARAVEAVRQQGLLQENDAVPADRLPEEKKTPGWMKILGFGKKTNEKPWVESLGPKTGRSIE